MKSRRNADRCTGCGCWCRVKGLDGVWRCGACGSTNSERQVPAWVPLNDRLKGCLYCHNEEGPFSPVGNLCTQRSLGQ